MRQRKRAGSLTFPAIALVSVTGHLLLNAPQSQALQFNFGFSDDTPPEVIQGFNDAGELWSSFLSDDVTIDLNIQFQSMDSPSLGQFVPQRVNFTYYDIVEALSNDMSSANDVTAFGALPKSSELGTVFDPDFSLDLLVNGTANNPNGAGSVIPYLDNSGDCNNRSIRITTANAKALGLSTTGSGLCGPSSLSQPPATDGTITLNSNFNWDFDISNGIDPLAYDFVGIAAQGIGVTLGHISGVDVLDFNSPLVDNGEVFFFDDGMLPFVSLPDLYRFSAESANLGVIDWTTGRVDATGVEVDKYFSIDGGETAIASFSTGAGKGDGNRASSWKADDLGGIYLGISEPTPNAGQILQFTKNDQILFDVIGWNISDPLNGVPKREPKDDDKPDPPDPTEPTPIPEPSSAIAFVPLVWLGIRWLSNKHRTGKTSTR